MLNGQGQCIKMDTWPGKLAPTTSMSDPQVDTLREVEVKPHSRTQPSCVNRTVDFCYSNSQQPMAVSINQNRPQIRISLFYYPGIDLAPIPHLLSPTEHVSQPSVPTPNVYHSWSRVPVTRISPWASRASSRDSCRERRACHPRDWAHE